MDADAVATHYPIRVIHQIEITSRCNLRCRYCPSPHLERPKQDMDEPTFRLALDWAKRFALEARRPFDLNLAGIGESTIHPDFLAYLALAREVMGRGTRLILATNGVNMTEALAQAMAPYSPTVFVSLHRPEKAGPAVEMLKRAGLLAGVSNDPSLAATDWAGQVKWHTSVPARRPCRWVQGGEVIVHADGWVSRCAYDASGVGRICRITDDLTRFRTTAYNLCRTCDQDVGVPYPPEIRP